MFMYFHGRDGWCVERVSSAGKTCQMKGKTLFELLHCIIVSVFPEKRTWSSPGAKLIPCLPGPFLKKSRSPTLAKEKNPCKESLSPISLHPALLINRALLQSISDPWDTTFPKYSAKWHDINPFAHAECESNRLNRLTHCLLWLYSPGPFCNQVGIMRIPSGYHLVKAGRSPVAASLAMRRRE